MSDPTIFLNAFAHVLAVMTLYPAEHRCGSGHSTPPMKSSPS